MSRNAKWSLSYQFTLGGDRRIVAEGLDLNNNEIGKLPIINSTGLNFLPSNISHACVCVGSFGDNSSPIKTHWLGKNAFSSQQFLIAPMILSLNILLL